MGLKNLIEYGKIGLGTVLSAGSVTYDIAHYQTQRLMEEAMYRSLEVVNPQTLLEARNTLDTYLSNNFNDDIGMVIGLCGAGAALVASGVYNLAKNLKKEKVE
jgi:hypothetical protein